MAGDWFGEMNKHLLSRLYGGFYFAINLGAAVSMFLCPWLLHYVSSFAAFGIPAALMVVGTIAYWAGRRKLVHIPAAGLKPSLGWQCLAYVFLTAAEIMVSITALEFSYTQAPEAMKSLVQAVFLLSISLGNAFTVVVNWFIRNPDGTSMLSGPGYYWFFVIAMLAAAVFFIPVARWYRPRDYIQDQAPAGARPHHHAGSFLRCRVSPDGVRL